MDFQEVFSITCNTLTRGKQCFTKTERQFRVVGQNFFQNLTCFKLLLVRGEKACLSCFGEVLVYSVAMEKIPITWGEFNSGV